MLSVNTDTATSRLRRYRRNSEEAAEAAMEAVADFIYEESQELVPVDTGELKRSGRKRKAGKLRWIVEYLKEYAAIVHDDISLNLRNGEHFFLRKPAMNNRRIGEILRKTYKRIIPKGVSR